MMVNTSTQILTAHDGQYRRADTAHDGQYQLTDTAHDVKYRRADLLTSLATSATKYHQKPLKRLQCIGTPLTSVI